MTLPSQLQFGHDRIPTRVVAVHMLVNVPVVILLDGDAGRKSEYAINRAGILLQPSCLRSGNRLSDTELMCSYMRILRRGEAAPSTPPPFTNRNAITNGSLQPHSNILQSSADSIPSESTGIPVEGTSGSSRYRLRVPTRNVSASSKHNL
jgi:hypothetical protein